MSLETKILFLILGANLAVLAAELWLRRRVPQFSALTALPGAYSALAAVVSYVFIRTPAAGMWVVAGATALAAIKNLGMAFSFSVLAGALVSAMFLGSILFMPHSAAVFYPAVIMSFIGPAAAFFFGALEYGSTRGKDSAFWVILAVFADLLVFGFLAATKWLFVSGWQAVSASVIVGMIIAITMAAFKRFPVSPVLFSASALGVGLFLAYLIGGGYGLAIASLTILAIQSTEAGRLRRASPPLEAGSGRLAEIGSSAFGLGVILSSALMLASYGAAVSRHHYLYDWQGPIVLFLIVPLAIVILSIKKLREETYGV